MILLRAAFTKLLKGFLNKKTLSDKTEVLRHLGDYGKSITFLYKYLSHRIGFKKIQKALYFKG